MVVATLRLRLLGRTGEALRSYQHGHRIEQRQRQRQRQFTC
jgi:hypothetical protein